MAGEARMNIIAKAGAAVFLCDGEDMSQLLDERVDRFELPNPARQAQSEYEDEMVHDRWICNVLEEFRDICHIHKDSLLPDGCPQCAQERNS
jgi:hypothetical protein